MRKVDEEFGLTGGSKYGGRDILADEGVGSREDWVLKPSDKWHGFGNLRRRLQHA